MLSEFINVFYVFLSSLFLYKYSDNTRWFYIHCIVNFLVVKYSYYNAMNCLINYNNCFMIEWNDDTYKTYWTAIHLHFIHLLFFKLTKDDIIHHTLMVLICGSLCYYNKSQLVSLALFFLTGLPGAIDYLLLFLVKIGVIPSIFEKKMYAFISSYIRAPGCTTAALLVIPGIIHYYKIKNYYQLICCCLISFLVYWNGQYYLSKTLKSYSVNDYILRTK